MSKCKAKEDESTRGSRRHEDRNYYKVSEPIYEEQEPDYEAHSYYDDRGVYHDYEGGSISKENIRRATLGP